MKHSVKEEKQQGSSPDANSIIAGILKLIWWPALLKGRKPKKQKESSGEVPQKSFLKRRWKAILAIWFIIVAITVIMDHLKLSEADDLWASGSKTEAVSIYNDNLSSEIDSERRSEIITRILTYHVENKDNAEINRTLARAYKYKATLPFYKFPPSVKEAWDAIESSDKKNTETKLAQEKREDAKNDLLEKAEDALGTFSKAEVENVENGIAKIKLPLGYSAKLTAQDLHVAVYELATEVKELKGIKIKIYIPDSYGNGLVDKYGNKIEGDTHLTYLAVDDLDEVRKYRNKDAYQFRDDKSFETYIGVAMRLKGIDPD